VERLSLPVRGDGRRADRPPVQQAGGGTGGDGEDLLDLTKEELYERAKEADIPGRSKMNKEELAQALQQSS
jgi:hypothetical protein